MNIFSRLFQRRKPFKPFLVQDKYRVIPAFEIEGRHFYQFENVNEAPTGRQLAALMVYNEMALKVDREYLEQHCKATRKLLSDPRKIDLTNIMLLNKHLEERLELMVLPEFVYKLASVIFFDKDEPIYSYDLEYNRKKIELWKQQDGTLDFFLNSPIGTMLPSWDMQPQDLKSYLGISEMVAKTHQEHLTDILSDSR